MRKNVGELDAFLRLTIGFLLLSIAIIKKSFWVALFSGKLIASGITKFCPLLFALGKNTNDVLCDFGYNDDFYDEYEDYDELDDDDYIELTTDTEE